jgi:hypothetical protein
MGPLMTVLLICEMDLLQLISYWDPLVTSRLTSGNHLRFYTFS